MRQAVGEPGVDEIDPGNHDDWYRARQVMDWQRVERAKGDDDIRLRRDQFGGAGFALFRVLAGQAALDDEIASFGPTEPSQDLEEIRAGTPRWWR